MHVVIVLVSQGRIALRTSATTFGRYGGRLKHSDKERYGYAGQLAAAESAAAAAAVEKVDTGRWKKCRIIRDIFMEKCIFALSNLLEKCRNDAVQKDPIIYR